MPSWIDEPTVGLSGAAAAADRLLALEQSGEGGRVIRLDRLLDLYDAARFTEDAVARDTLWLALGSASARGSAASREASLRMLDEAYAIDELESLADDRREFVTDAIALLEADMVLPHSAESLIDQTRAYRMLAESGHPRIADNARLRLYDFVRGVLRASVEVGPGRRVEVAVHALYAERDDVSAWLDDGVLDVPPPLPSAEQLWTLLDAQTSALADLPRWRAVLEARTDDDAELREISSTLLPRPRDPAAWALRWSHYGEIESLAPVVLLRPGELILEPGGPDGETLTPGTPEGREGIERLLVRDGRGVLLLAADPELPVREFAAGLAAMVAARVTTIELAVRDRRSDDGRGVLALPLHVVHADEVSPRARAIREARIQVRLTGKFARFAIDGGWMSEVAYHPDQMRELVGRLRAAYPHERVVRISLDAGVAPDDLVHLAVAILDGRAFSAIGWLADQPVVALRLPKPDRSRFDAVLHRRVRLANSRSPELELDDEVRGVDGRVLNKLAWDLHRCLPELEARMPESGIAITLVFAELELEKLVVRGKGVARDRLAALELCADEQSFSRHLREHRDPLKVVVRFE